ncbi:Na/Pi cotransporter family protein [Pseudoxanthomonas wuyuanensis]|uniref:Na/Pi-cotransporter n=1 Tax=Pseudoxanthomonas wuyuanensis TaxID=1073196 RepID=A0A286DEK9_9GAMM|nr:Na/Pi symporter [Pseudoxanthomonas wuyuanensis]KAF1715474.1 Na/Pi cotransporter family protein [Pseudoxanthomonas wuyuanensis]SOD57063.1 Na/Pi-cotransporter [Pseudoxanthomonas wuyuanensis]
MPAFQIAIAALAAIVLFLHALQGFNDELRRAGGAWLQDRLGRTAEYRLFGFMLGAGATALLQSSSATSSLTVALVDAGVLSFRSSLGVLLGANVGTTVTAWLVSFKLTGIGPLFIVLGTLLSLSPVRLRVVGKAVFYFGLIFFALDLISHALQPLQAQPGWQAVMQWADTPWTAVLIGLLATALIQSSSVVVGLAVLLAQQQQLPAESAIAMALGSNLGTTSTALIASLGMRGAARSSALANFAFNGATLVMLLPALPWLARYMAQLIPRPDMAVAVTHLGFNLLMAAIFLPLLGPLEPWLRWLERRAHAQVRPG